VTVWQTKDWTSKIYKNELTSRVEGVAFSTDGSKLIAASDAYNRLAEGNPWDGNRVTTWDVNTCKATDSIVLNNDEKGVGAVVQLAAASKLGLIALARSGGVPLVVDLQTGKLKYVPEKHVGSCASVAFSPDNSRLAACAPTAPVLRIYESTSGKRLAVAELLKTDAHCIAFSPNGSQLAVGRSDGKVTILSDKLDKTIATILIDDTILIETISYSADGGYLAASTKSAVFLFDAKLFKRCHIFDKNDLRINAIAFSPDGKYLAAGCGQDSSRRDGAKDKQSGGVVKIWETSTGKLFKELK